MAEFGTSFMMGGSGGSIDGLSDVVITAVASNNVLYYNGTNWVNATPDVAGLVDKSATAQTKVGALTIQADNGLTLNSSAASLVLVANTSQGVRIGSFTFCDAGNTVFNINSSGIGLDPSHAYSFSNSINNPWQTKDTSFYRIAAGVTRTGTGAASGSGFHQQLGDLRVAADVTVDSTTPSAITGLSITLVAGRTYSFNLVLFSNTPTVADGLRIDFDGGAATATDFVACGTVSDSVSTRILAQVTALATDLVDTLTTGDAITRISGTITVNAGGTFIVRGGKEADAGAGVVFRRGSYMIVRDMP